MVQRLKTLCIKGEALSVELATEEEMEIWVHLGTLLWSW